MKQHLTTHRAALALALLAGSACDPPAVLEMPLPDGLPIAELSDAQRALLRATIAVSDGALSETDVTFDVDDLVIRGDFALQNVTSAGDRTMTLRVYGRSAQAPLTDPLTGLKLERAEVLLGAVSTTLAVSPSQETRISFAGASFESCAPGLDGHCGVLFDENRNRSSNVLDLVAGIDPAPQAPFLEVSPSTLQFPSGISLGQFARQVIVLENRGPNPVQAVRAEVVGGQGVALSVFDPSDGQASAPGRALDADALAGATGIIAPSDELFLAVSFAPVNLFFTTAAVQVVVEDTVTHVQQTVRTKVLANTQGTLRPPSPDYVPPEVADLALELGTLPVTAFPTAQLFNGLAIKGAATGGLAHTGALLLSEDADGAPIALPADLAFAVDIPPRHRFSTSVGGLSSDVDVGVFSVDAAGIGALACPTCFSSHSGSSPEAAEFTNDSDLPLRVVIVLGRADLAPVVEAVEGALVAGDLNTNYEVTATTTFGPEFDGEGAVSPSDGPLEGGVLVTLKGRGFDPLATVTFADAIALDAVITTDAAGRSTVSLTLPPGSLEAGKNPATIVVVNPPPEAGGDGQAATLPEGFTYQPPAPRLTGVAPSIATTTGTGVPITLDGSLFSSRFGAPVVAFGDILVDATFVNSTQLIVTAPALAADEQDEPKTVALTVANCLKPDNTAPDVRRTGSPSNAREFRFQVPVGAAPTIASVAPALGTVDGGETVAILGTGFRSGAAVFIGGVSAAAGNATDGGTSIAATTPARAADGPVDVIVINDDGQSATASGAFAYTIPAPSITSVFPDRAVISGGALIVVGGSGFREGATATFVVGSDATPAAGVTRASSTTLLVTTPQLATGGTATLTIENPDGQQASFSGFELFEPAGPPPTVSSIEPARGGAAGGYLITLLGNGFVTPAVLFGSAVLSGDALDVVTAASGSGGIDRISFTAPASATGLGGTVAVQVINADTQSDGTSFTFEVAPSAAPRVDRVVPGRISGIAATPFSVFGANLEDTVEVLAGGAPIPFFVASSFQVDATLPPSPAGPLPITVATASGDIASFPIIVSGPPSLQGLSSSLVHAGVAGDQLALFGDGLDAEDLFIDVRGDGPSGPVDLPTRLLTASEGLMVVQLPRLAAQDELRLVVRAGSALHSLGELESPRFSARAPLVTFMEVTDIAQNGTLTFTAFGEQLNPERLTSILLVDLSGAGRNVPCVMQSASERSATCRTPIAAFPARSYGIALEYTEEFAGASSRVSLVVTDADGLPQQVFVPDVGQLIECGDEFVRPNEECDDGNLDNRDSCTDACSRAACGDGFVQAGEGCDDGNAVDEDACRNGCVLASCGDGAPQPGEQCDDGNDSDTDACTSACTLPVCGDDFVQAGEECDDGNPVEEDGCNTACALGVCGDAIVQLGESCDDGNLVDTDDCSNSCALGSCGDAQLQIGEECDDGNLVDADECTNTCRATACGDGILQVQESCDDGNLDDSDQCTSLCLNAVCGDGFVHVDEQCDDGNLVDTDRCTSICQTARCGDALTQLAEECDDGNLINTDRCTTACTAERCGDTFIQVGESCDDGNINNGDDCTNSCVLASCGDALLQVGEACDDGNLVDNDTCSNACRLPVCGDAIVHLGEDCDDGNASNQDACTNTCALAACGDAFVQAGEQCDDGNQNDADVCTSACLIGVCGDAITQDTEGCDDANTIDNDACTNACTRPRCGDSIVQIREQCDDGDLIDTNQCTNACRFPAALNLDLARNDFGSVLLGDTGVAVRFTVTNPGGSVSGLLGVLLRGPDAGNFSVVADACTGVSLAAGGSCTLTINFVPTTRGAKAIDLIVSASPGGGTFATLSGIGLTPASLVISPATQDLGTIPIGAASGDAVFTVTNPGDVPTGALTAALTRAAATQFIIAADTCTGALPAGGTCDVSVHFAPTAAGAAAASLVLSGTPGGSATAALTATGITAARLQLSPATHSFGSIVVGSTSTAKTFTVTNVGAASSGAVAVALSGGDAALFSVTANTCTTLAGGASCTFALNFTPTTTGNKAASVSISASPGGSATATLSGTSITAAALSLAPSSLNFGNVVVNTASAPITFTVGNSGAGTSGAVSVAVTGADASKFAVSANTCMVLAGGATCTFAVTFTSTTTGAKSASISVSASPGGSAAATLSGTSITAAALSLSPPSSSFGSIVVNTTSAPITFTVGNSGAGTSGAVSVALTDASNFAVAANTCTTLAGGATCTFTVSFAPATTGSKVASLTVSASPGGTATASLTGTSLSAAALALSPSSANFGTVVVNTAGAPTTFTVVNNGGSASGGINVALSGTDASSFAVTSNTCAALAAAATCTFTVRLAPSTTGNKAASVSVSASPGGIASASLTGTAVADAALALGPPSFNFGNATVGVPSTSNVFAVQNTGGASSGVLGTSLQGVDASEFEILADSCNGAALAAGQTCIVDLRFNASSAGSKSASLVLSASPGGAAAASLFGNATVPAPTGNVLSNGTFTGGFAGWTAVNQPIGDQVPWTSDGALAFVQSSAGPGARLLAQGFVAPASVTSAIFQFSIAFQPGQVLDPQNVPVIQQGLPPGPGNALRFDIIDAGGDVFSNAILVELFAPLSGTGTIPSGLVPVSVDTTALLAFLQANPGRNLQLRIGHVESTFPFQVFLDDVVLDLGASAAINVVEATYGPECGVPTNGPGGTHLASLQSVCSGNTSGSCLYPSSGNIVTSLGDAAPGCSKSYLARWDCGGGSPLQTVVVPAEAAGGTVTLTCP